MLHARNEVEDAFVHKTASLSKWPTTIRELSSESSFHRVPGHTERMRLDACSLQILHDVGLWEGLEVDMPVLVTVLVTRHLLLFEVTLDLSEAGEVVAVTMLTLGDGRRGITSGSEETAGLLVFGSVAGELQRCVCGTIVYQFAC